MPSNLRTDRDTKRLARTTLLLGLLSVGCSTEGEGTVTIRSYGESFIEDGIPADDVKDGWSVEFDKFIVDIEDVVVGGTTIEVDEKVDVAKGSSGEGHEIGSGLVKEGSHSHSSFTIERVEIEGSATKGDATKTFHWIIKDATRYSHCETTTKVAEGNEGTFQITLHADHLLYDSLVSEEPDVVFQAYAEADIDGDGEITEAELAATDIGYYDPGSEGGVDDLWTWLVAQSRTLGHVDGEGHCEAKAVK